MPTIHTDVAIIGAGPGGSTAGGFLRKYDPSLRVSIFERDEFPRDHVGESQLPLIGKILHELGVWDKVEAADFPVKIGATYRWGKTTDLWDFHFVPGGEFTEEARPAKYQGQRQFTAFQVDRALYDQILADHAAELGCEIHYRTPVRKVERDGDRVTALVLADGTQVEADVYIDASGHSGILRRTMGVGIEEPSQLRNVAFWDYWQNADWAVSVGVGGTRVQVMSLGYGWLWFIPLGPTRTSVGLVCPAEYLKDSGRTPKELYNQAIQDEPRIRSLMTQATSEGKFTTTKDWSFVAERMAGENWFLVGESLGFADPILAAGLTLTHASARECAFSILEAHRGGDNAWLKKQYEERNRRRVLQHIRFADYWYSANANFTDLKEYTREIARDAGLDLDANDAFQWLGTGGFVEVDMNRGGLGTVSLLALHQITRRFSEKRAKVEIDQTNHYVLHEDGAEETTFAQYADGGVQATAALARDGKWLPLYGMFRHIRDGLRESPEFDRLLAFVQKRYADAGVPFGFPARLSLFEALEAMTRDGWVEARRAGWGPAVDFNIPDDTPAIMANRDALRE